MRKQEQLLEYVEQKFTEKNWRMTAAVKNVIRILAPLLAPASVLEILKHLKYSEIKADKATVFRILDKLISIGAAHKITGKYMPCCDPTNHQAHHFLVDKVTGRTEEIFLNYHDSLAPQLKKEKNFLLEDTEITFLGRFQGRVDPRKFE